MVENIHITMGDSATGCLIAAIKMNKNSEYYGRVINFYDDLSFGSIENLVDCLENRISWMNNMFAVTKLSQLFSQNEVQQNFENLYKHELNIPTNSKVIIWCSDNVIEQTLLRYLVSRFKNYKLYSINVSETIEKDYHVRAVAECSPDELLGIFNKITIINENIKTELKLEWMNLQTSELRIFADKKVIGTDITYYDNLLLNCLTDQFQPAPKIVGTVMGLSEQVVGDTFLDYRLRLLIEKSLVMFSGKLNLLKDFKVKRAR